MLGVQVSRVVPVYPYTVYIQWEVTSRFSTGVGPTLSQVYRGEAPDGPWTELTVAPLADTFYFLDTLTIPATAGMRALSRNWYYRVRIYDGVEEAYSNPVDLMETTYEVMEQTSPLPGDPLPSDSTPRLPRDRQRVILERRKILRDLWTVLTRGGKGWKFAILKKRHLGTRCTNPECWDPATQQAMLQNCPICLGTGWVQGYYPAFYTVAERRPTTPTLKVEPAMSEEAVHHFMFLDLPAITHGDVLVDAERNQRYQVESSRPTEIRGIRVQQYLTAALLNRDDPVYSVAVDRDGEYSARVDLGWH